MPIREVHVCMHVYLQLPRADHVLRFSIEDASKRLDYLAVVYHEAVPAFCHCCHPTGRWLPTLWVQKHGLIEEPLMGAVFESVARRTSRTATSAVPV